MKRVYGVMGYPVAHSLSPVMHNFWFQKLGIEGVYGCFEVKPEEFDNAVKGIKALGIRGVSITIPHKERALELADEPQQAALEIGAANTFSLEEGLLKAYNTDWIGVLKAFEEKKITLKGKRVVILGAGGAARAVCYAIKQAGAKELLIFNRTFEKAKRLAEKLKATAREWKTLSLAEGDVLINTTSVGLESDETPVGEEVISRFKIFMDIVYTPLKTKFLKIAEKYGVIIDGLDMLIYQGAEQFKIWTGVYPPAREVRELLIKELEKRGKLEAG